MAVVSALFRVILSSWAEQKRNRSWSWTQWGPVQQSCSGCPLLSVDHRVENSLRLLNSFWFVLRFIHLTDCLYTLVGHFTARRCIRKCSICCLAVCHIVEGYQILPINEVERRMINRKSSFSRLLLVQSYISTALFQHCGHFVYALLYYSN